MIHNLLLSAPSASRSLFSLPTEQTNALLRRLADLIATSADTIIAANAIDLKAMSDEDSRYDRLQLSLSRIQAMAHDLRNVAELPSPLNKTLSETKRPNGMVIKKVSVPFGVIGIIYEARPNVTTDVFSLCFKAGSACVLKGGKEAAESNRILVQVIHQALQEAGLSTEICQLLPNDHEATEEMLHAVGLIDLVIPRGSSRLIQFVRENARIPVIETGAGICHTYFDRSGNIAKGAAIIHNGKTRRVGVCNALDCLLIHKERLTDLPQLVAPLASDEVLLYVDESSESVLQGNYPKHLLQSALPEHYGMEMLSYRMAIRTVETIEEALEHIAHHSSRHSESIVADDQETSHQFEQMVDAACVYTNLPTSWTDGSQFGLGAEIGISTQKLHARGPMGLEEIVTYKYLISGEGQIRK